jgi:hypothetical protein
MEEENIPGYVNYAKKKPLDVNIYLPISRDIKNERSRYSE